MYPIVLKIKTKNKINSKKLHSLSSALLSFNIKTNKFYKIYFVFFLRKTLGKA